MLYLHHMGRALLTTILLTTLLVPLAHATKQYHSGELWSRQTVTYGRFDVVMKPAEGDGIISSFFLFKEIPYPQHPWREIDIEILGANPYEVSTNLITHYENRTGNTATHPVDVNLSKGFHTYTIEWTPDEISWYIDGILLRRANKVIVKQFRNEKLTFRFNLWSTHLDNWAGEFKDHILPVQHTIQSITYSKYTPHETFKGKPFKFVWKDNFDRIERGRWRKADWSFEENLAQFTKNNVFTRKGKLIIRLDKRDNI